MKRLAAILLTTLIPILLRAGSIEPVQLRCEYRINPIGIDVEQPVFGWQLASTLRNQAQMAYEVRVAEALQDLKTGSKLIWQSGKILSGKSFAVAYEGRPLESMKRYYWTVRVYDANGIASSWCTPAFFEMGLLKTTDWKAKWIGDEREQFKQEEDFYQEDPMPLFRKKIVSSKKVSRAGLYISGLGYYEAYLNHKKIGDRVLDPGFTAYSKEVQYSVYDVTKSLTTGENVLGIMVGNGWFNPLPMRLFGRFNLRGIMETGRPMILAQMKIWYADGTEQLIATDESWETIPGPIIRNNIYLGEEYDARKEKNFEEELGWRSARFVKGPAGILKSASQPPTRVTRILRPVSIKEIGQDTFIVDMGQNFAGVVSIKLNGPAGRKIGFRYGEDIFKDGRLNYFTSVAGQIKEQWKVNAGPGAPKTAWQRDEYTLKGTKEESWSPRFTFHGFRYVEITGWPGKPGIESIQGLRMNSDLEKNGSFECSDPSLNKLHEAIQWTFLSNVFSVQSDCPAREKMGYGGDLVATGESYIYNYDMHGFYRKTINDFANDQQPDGGITEIAPFPGIADRGYGGYSGPLGWQLAFPFLQDQLYQYYGDISILKNYYTAFKKQMAFLESKSQQGLFFWDISDHEALDTKPEAFTAACFYYHHVLLAKKFAGLLGERPDSIRYDRLANTIKQAIIERYYVWGTGRFDNGTQSAQLFALYYKLSPEPAKTIEALVKEFSRKDDHLSTGIFSTKMMFEVMSENGLSDLLSKVAMQKTFPGWLNMIESGATTLWESWQYSDNTYSQNHPMFGSIEEWFYKVLLGIQPASPGFSEIIIKPHTEGGLQWAKGTYHSVSGEISCSWKKEGGRFSLNLGIPAGVKARVFVPCREGALIKESGKIIQNTAGKYQGDFFEVEIGSGNYHFEAE